MHDKKHGKGLVASGAICECHSNEADALRCQKQVHVGSGTPEEARRLVKGWLLLGRDIPKLAKDGRANHVHVIGKQLRALVPDDWTEEAMERML